MRKDISDKTRDNAMSHARDEYLRGSTWLTRDVKIGVCDKIGSTVWIKVWWGMGEGSHR